MGGVNVDEFEVLLDAGAAINYLSSERYTPLMYALKNNHIETVKKLVERGADVGYSHGLNALTLLKEHEDWTPLHYEVEKMIQNAFTIVKTKKQVKSKLISQIIR